MFSFNSDSWLQAWTLRTQPLVRLSKIDFLTVPELVDISDIKLEIGYRTGILYFVLSWRTCVVVGVLSLYIFFY